MKIKDPFIVMILYALVAALIGLVTGFLLGWLIYGIGTLFYTDISRDGLYYAAPFLGMGSGTFLGALMGAIVGIKKMK